MRVAAIYDIHGNLPAPSGHHLARAIASLRPISGYGMAEGVEQSLAAGFVEHLTKPIYPKSPSVAARRGPAHPPGEAPSPPRRRPATHPGGDGPAEAT
ncbi:MAG: hypothetical protein M3O15_12960 [Acidobacteriota bacterium]|nr:hypothetical protein [Acidobacteriota bacterium]